MNYKHIERAIEFAIEEVRNERFEANQRGELDINVFKMLDNIQDILRQALIEIGPF